MTENLIATKTFTYKGHSLKEGDPFEAGSQDARILVAIGKAKLPPPTKEDAGPDEQKVPTPDEPEEAQRKQAKPATKDFTAEEDEDDAEEQADEAPKAKRKYQRRDLEAEK